MDLLLISGLSAFFLALLKPFIGFPALRVALCLVTSIAGTLLIHTHNINYFILYVGSSAFFAPILVLIGERLNSYQPTIIHAVGNDR